MTKENMKVAFVIVLIVVVISLLVAVVVSTERREYRRKNTWEYVTTITVESHEYMKGGWSDFPKTIVKSEGGAVYIFAGHVSIPSGVVDIEINGKDVYRMRASEASREKVE